MKITHGKYTLVTDSLKNMWIEETYTGKTKDEQEKEYTKRITGYFQDFSSLARDFLKKELCSSDAELVKNALVTLQHAENEIENIYSRYKEELAKMN